MHVALSDRTVRSYIEPTMSLLNGSAVSLCALLSTVLLILLTMPYLFSSKKWDAKGKHVLITGGSQGLGLAVAQELARRGDAASITIVARDEGKLRKAIEAIEQALPAASTSSKTATKCNYISADLSTFAGASKAFEKHAATHGAPPDTVFCCAGGAKPGYFLDQDEADFQLGMKTDYWTALATAHVREASRHDSWMLSCACASSHIFSPFVFHAQRPPAGRCVTQGWKAGG